MPTAGKVVENETKPARNTCYDSVLIIDSGKGSIATRHYDGGARSARGDLNSARK